MIISILKISFIAACITIGFDTATHEGGILYFYRRALLILARSNEMLAKLLGLCVFCFAGQIAFWGCVFLGFDFELALMLVFCTIFFTRLLNGILNKLE